MTQQVTLDGFAPPAPTDRLFLAIFPDQAAISRIETLAMAERDRYGVCGKLLEPSRLHVTLFHLGDWVGIPGDIVSAASRAMSKMGAESFDVCFDRVETFNNRRDKNPFVLTASDGNESLHSFHAHLGALLRGEGLGKWAAPSFKPHVTLTYDAKNIPSHVTEPVSWRACEVVLVHSLLGKTQHVRLGQWPLTSEC